MDGLRRFQFSVSLAGCRTPPFFQRAPFFKNEPTTSFRKMPKTVLSNPSEIVIHKNPKSIVLIPSTTYSQFFRFAETPRQNTHV
jgi:hypothetical protein